jgi:hypothetical protein
LKFSLKIAGNQFDDWIGYLNASKCHSYRWQWCENLLCIATLNLFSQKCVTPDWESIYTC